MKKNNESIIMGVDIAKGESKMGEVIYSYGKILYSGTPLCKLSYSNRYRVLAATSLGLRVSVSTPGSAILDTNNGRKDSIIIDECVLSDE